MNYRRALVLGPRFSLKMGEGNVFVSPLISCSLVDVSVDRHEAFSLTPVGGAPTTLQSWSDNADKQAFRFGAGIFAGADWPLSAKWALGVKAGYQAVFDDVKVDVGPNQVTVDPSGLSVVVGVSRQL